MRKNQLRIGLKSNKKLKDSFYYFIVDNRIDWAFILGAFFCMLPYLVVRSLNSITYKYFVSLVKPNRDANYKKTKISC